MKHVVHLLLLYFSIDFTSKDILNLLTHQHQQSFLFGKKSMLRLKKWVASVGMLADANACE